MSERRSTLWFIFLRVDFLKPQKHECSNYQCLWTISFFYWFLFYIRVRQLPIKKLLHLIKTSSEHIFNIETGCRSCSLSRFAIQCNRNDTKLLQDELHEGIKIAFLWHSLSFKCYTYRKRTNVHQIWTEITWMQQFY